VLGRVTREEVTEIEGEAKLAGKGNAVQMGGAISLFFVLVLLPGNPMN
jgi:hypothetical protein